MIVRPKQAWLRRLERLQRKQKGKRKTHYVFPLPGESADAEIRKLIASGQAKATDKFIIFSWGDPVPAHGAGKPSSNGPAV